jgi:hypothetical protein
MINFSILINYNSLILIMNKKILNNYYKINKTEDLKDSKLKSYDKIKKQKTNNHKKKKQKMRSK